MKTINVFTENIFPDWKVDEKDVIDKTKSMLKFLIKELGSQSCVSNYEHDSITLDIVFCDSEKTHELNRDYREKAGSVCVPRFPVPRARLFSPPAGAQSQAP